MLRSKRARAPGRAARARPPASCSRAQRSIRRFGAAARRRRRWSSRRGPRIDGDAPSRCIPRGATPGSRHCLSERGRFGGAGAWVPGEVQVGDTPSRATTNPSPSSRSRLERTSGVSHEDSIEWERLGESSRNGPSEECPRNASVAVTKREREASRVGPAGDAAADDRSTPVPSFDIERYARESDANIRVEDEPPDHPPCRTGIRGLERSPLP